MGTCASTEYYERKETDENIVYVVDKEGTISDDGKRKLASLFSQRGKKGPNQDAAILCQGFGMDEGIFCGVFDGHGQNGHLISKLVRDYLPFLILSERNSLFLSKNNDSNFSDEENNYDPLTDLHSPNSVISSQIFEDWKEACVNGFKAMDKEIGMKSNLDSSFSGTTAVSIIKQGRDLIIANVGDSRAILARETEKGLIEAIQLTTDLKPSIPQEAERIKRNNGRVFALKDEPHIQRVWLPDANFPGLAMARSLGDFQLKCYGVISTPQVSYHEISRKDLFVVIATDGVWDVLSNEEVVKIVRETKRKMDASSAIVEAAVEAWKFKYPASKIDDCTAACLFFA
ncbi:hypothetical protein LUZ60_012314 [Juncus effusus]|nr:hypothetical protein LUZ60_012314 [Juncus effusus]